MNKNLLVFLSLFIVLLAWCTINNNQVVEVDQQEGEQLFNNQIDDFQYIKDLEDFLSYDILSVTDNKPFTSEFLFSAKFDEKSSVWWWLSFSWNKAVESHDLESSNIEFKVNMENKEENLEPFDLSWSVSLLYKDSEMYAKLHSLDVFMWEGNMVAKMYALLWNLVIDNRVNLEVHSWWIVVLDEKWNDKIPYIIWTLKDILKTENIQTSSNFLWSLAELIDLINSYVDLWVSTNELSILNQEVSYFKLSDWSIQKMFTWSFQWRESVFDLSFVVSKKGLEVHLYNIGEYNEKVSDYEDVNKEFKFLLKEDKKSEYLVNFESLKLQQKLVDLQWEIQYTDRLRFLANFVLEQLDFVSWQRVSWELDWNIIKHSWEWNKEKIELTGNILLWSDILASL